MLELCVRVDEATIPVVNECSVVVSFAREYTEVSREFYLPEKSL